MKRELLQECIEAFKEPPTVLQLSEYMTELGIPNTKRNVRLYIYKYKLEYLLKINKRTGKQSCQNKRKHVIQVENSKYTEINNKNKEFWNDVDKYYNRALEILSDY